jgi:hypothetical protein
MYVDSVQKADRVTAARIVNEATGWGLPRKRVEAIVLDLLARLPAAVTAAADETEGLPPELPELVEKRIDQLEVGR